MPIFFHLLPCSNSLPQYDMPPPFIAPGLLKAISHQVVLVCRGGKVGATDANVASVTKRLFALLFCAGGTVLSFERQHPAELNVA